MNVLEKSIQLINLYDLYQELLTDKQKGYFEDYYFNNYSITEISENFEVSRNAVHDQLKRTAAKLNDLESKLHLFDILKKRKAIIKKIHEINNNKEIQNLLSELEKVE